MAKNVAPGRKQMRGAGANPFVVSRRELPRLHTCIHSQSFSQERNEEPPMDLLTKITKQPPELSPGQDQEEEEGK